jgi:hypothetical protein
VQIVSIWCIIVSIIVIHIVSIIVIHTVVAAVDGFEDLSAEQIHTVYRCRYVDADIQIGKRQRCEGKGG